MLKNLLRIICTVIVTYSGMIAADDEVCASIIFSYHRMENRFSWTCITHGCWEYCQKYTILRIIVLSITLDSFPF